MAIPSKPAAGQLYKVPDPYPLTLAGLIAAMGPQAINFGISIGGGETMLIPRAAALGATNMFWIMSVSAVLETVVVIECVKHALVTGRSFFAATRDLPGGKFWPYFWAAAAFLTYFWPAWMAGAANALAKLTGLFDPYIWSVFGLLMCLGVFWLSPHIYGVISKLFIAIMWINIITVLVMVFLIATPADFLFVLQGYLNPFTGLPQPLPAGHPAAGQKFRLEEVCALFNQPGGSLMWVSLWALEAGWGMGRYYGKVTGVLRPPEKINTGVLQWDTKDPSEVSKMRQWIKVGDWSQIVWWTIIGAFGMTFLYGTMGHAYLFKQGVVKSGGDIPLQIAYVAGGIGGPVMLTIFLVFIVATLYDAEFAYYDTFVGRTVTESIATNNPGAVNRKRTYRWYYLATVTLVIFCGFYLLTINQPYELWLFNAFGSLVWRSLAAIQIWWLNKRLPEPFRPGTIRTALLWLTAISGLSVNVIWIYAYFNKL
jgi:hypothetical protein